MKSHVFIILSLMLSGCALFNANSKRGPEVVASCFSDGEDKTGVCKAQRINDEGKIVVTRCIGFTNHEAKPNLRGKCVEKICSGGSNTDCTTRGEFAVLEQYAELTTANLFASDEEGGAPAGKPQKGAKGKAALTAQTVASVAPPTAAEIAASEKAAKNEAAAAAAAAAAEKKAKEEKAAKEEKTAAKEEAPVEKEKQYKIALKAAKKSRTQASIKPEKGFKKVCVSKNDFGAPDTLRGKCATRNCNAKGKCSYQGRKEMFDWVSSNE